MEIRRSTDIWFFILLILLGSTSGKGQDCQSFYDITYDSIAGVDPKLLSLDIHIPGDEQDDYPVVIYVHGGSWQVGDKTNTRYKDEWMCGKGFVFVSINYRLSPHPPELDNSSRITYPVHPRDVASAIAWVYEHIDAFGGDPSRMALLGHSAGAHLVSIVATDSSFLEDHGLTTDQLKCICALDGGAYDIPYYLENYPDEGSIPWERYVNAFTQNPGIWHIASPINHLNGNEDMPEFMLVFQRTPQRIDLAYHFGSALIENEIPLTYLNAHPLDHSEINRQLGNPDPAFQMYNDTIGNFFTNCLDASDTHSEHAYRTDKLKIFPNPFDSGFYIRDSATQGLAEKQIEIYTANGRLIQSISLERTVQWIEFDVSPPGLYILKWYTDANSGYKKLIRN